MKNIVSIAASDKNAYAVDNEGHVYVWGQNNHGQIGDATYFERLYPVLQSDLNNVKSVSAGTDFAITLNTNNNLYGWGINSSGQVGNSTSDEQLIPVAAGSNSKLVVRDAKIVTVDTPGVALTSGTVSSYADLATMPALTTLDVHGAIIQLVSI